jgi:hypothetical protein
MRGFRHRRSLQAHGPDSASTIELSRLAEGGSGAADTGEKARQLPTIVRSCSDIDSADVSEV